MIRKQINISSSVGRLGTRIPDVLDDSQYDDYSQYSDWGHLPCDIRLRWAGNGEEEGASTYIGSYLGVDPTYYDSFFLMSDQFPLSMNHKGEVVLRYRTLSYLYNLIRRVAAEAEYWRVCRRGNSAVLVPMTDNVWESAYGISRYNEDGSEDPEYRFKYLFFSNEITEKRPTNINYVTELPSGVDLFDMVGQVYCLHPELEEYANRLFLWSTDRLDCKIYDLVKRLHSTDLNNENTKAVLFAEPYIDVPIYIDATIDGHETSKFLPVVEEWTPSKRNYQNDMVIYYREGVPHLYRLKTLPNSMYSGVEEVEVTESVYNAINKREGNGKIIRTYANVKHYLIQEPYYKGNYVERLQRTFFDEIDPDGNVIFDDNGNTVHWELMTGTTESVIINVEQGSTSDLASFLRSKRFYDDEYNELPFIPVSGGSTELNIAFGYGGKEVVDGEYIVDKLECIEIQGNPDEYAAFYGTEGEQKRVSINNVEVQEVIKGGTKGYITFNYIEGLRYGDSGVLSGGVRKSESYRFTIDYYYGYVEDPSGNTNLGWSEYYGEEEGTEVSVLPNPSEYSYGDIVVVTGSTVSECGCVPSGYTENQKYINLRKYTYINVDYSIPYVKDEDGNFYEWVRGDEGATSVSYGEFGMTEQRHTWDMHSIPINGVSYAIFLNEDIDLSGLERGTAAAYERHMALGEVNTFQDMQEYRNGFFTPNS